LIGHNTKFFRAADQSERELRILPTAITSMIGDKCFKLNLRTLTTSSENERQRVYLCELDDGIRYVKQTTKVGLSLHVLVIVNLS